MKKWSELKWWAKVLWGMGGSFVGLVILFEGLAILVAIVGPSRPAPNAETARPQATAEKRAAETAETKEAAPVVEPTSTRETAKSKAGETAETWHNKGLALYNQGHFEDAVKSYDRALEINPNYTDAWTNKGLALHKLGLHNLGLYEEEVKCYDRALEINPRLVETWTNKGYALYNLGHNEDALKCYERALEINPNYADAWYNKGVMLHYLGRYRDAVKSYDRALEINPNYTDAWTNKGIALRKGGYDAVKTGYTTYRIGRSWWSSRLSDNEFLNQRPDAMFLFVTLAVRNDDRKARSIPLFNLIDENGAEHESSSKAFALDGWIGGLESLNPGVEKRGFIVFDVPTNHRYKLKVSGGFWSGESALIELFPD